MLAPAPPSSGSTVPAAPGQPASLPPRQPASLPPGSRLRCLPGSRLRRIVTAAKLAPVARPVADSMVRFLSEDGSLSVRAVSGRDLVAEASRRHACSALGTVALGRTLLGALLLATGGKGDQTVQVRFRGNGPLGHLVAIASGDGRVRGYATRPEAQLPPRGGRIDVAGGIGFGEVAVVRTRPGAGRPYTGIVPITAGEVAEDLALYLAESEQTPSALALGVLLDDAGAVAHAGGYLAQALPGADPDAVVQLEANVRMLSAPTDWLAAGGDPAGMAEALLAGMNGRLLQEDPALYHCGCNLERVTRAVALLGRPDLDKAVAAGDDLEVNCEFCAEHYAVDPQQALALLAEA